MDARGGQDDGDAPGRLDPDARFLLANERTLLAWVRTSITLQAGGIATLQFADVGDLTTGIGLAAVVLGIVAAAAGRRRYRDADRAIRRGDLPATGRIPDAVTLGVMGIGAVLVLAVLVGAGS